VVLDAAQVARNEVVVGTKGTSVLTPTRDVWVQCDGGPLPSPDGHFLVYGQAADPVEAKQLNPVPVQPTLRRINTITGEDTLFLDGACAPAWSHDGRLAYVRGTTAGWSTLPYLGQVVVQTTVPSAPPQVWTDQADTYQWLLWAGPRLLAERLRWPTTPGASVESEIVALDGPGQTRVLAESYSTLVALSQDGERALLSTRDSQTAGDTGARLSLVRLADGAKLGSLDFCGHCLGSLETLVQGVWQGDRVVTLLGGTPTGSLHPDSELVVLSVAGNQPVVQQVLGFDDKRIGPTSLVDLVPQSGDQFLVVLGRFRPPSLMACDLGQRTCVLDRTLPTGYRDARIVQNPSRPEH
jgi:hypothetical protein